MIDINISTAQNLSILGSAERALDADKEAKASQKRLEALQDRQARGIETQDEYVETKDADGLSVVTRRRPRGEEPSAESSEPILQALGADDDDVQGEKKDLLPEGLGGHLDIEG